MIFNEYTIYIMCSAGYKCLTALFFFYWTSSFRLPPQRYLAAIMNLEPRDYYRKCFAEKHSESRLFDIYMA